MKSVLKTGIFAAAMTSIIVTFFVARLIRLNFITPHGASANNACINNLRNLDAATEQWILESGKAPTNKPTWSEIKPYLGRDTEASLTRYHCPEDSSKSFSTSYILGSATVPPRCKINPKHKLN